MSKNKNDRTFIRVTNKHIFNKLVGMETKITNIEKHAIKTNGTLQWHTKAIYALFSGFMIIAGWIVLSRG